MRSVALPFLLLMSFVLSSNLSNAQEPPKVYSIVSPGGVPPQVELNSVLSLRIGGDGELDPKQAQLRIGDYLLGVYPTWLADTREFHFLLKRTDGSDSNKPMWAALLGSPFSATRSTQSIALIYAGKALTYQKTAGKDDEAPTSQIFIRKFSLPFMCLGLIAAVAVIGGVVWLGIKTPMLRDVATLPQILPMQRPYSLGRCQMAVWFSIVISSFLFIFVVLWDLTSINTESFALLGISATTALGSVAIDLSKDVGTTKMSADLIAMGIKSEADVLELDQVVNKGRNGTVQATTVIPAAVVPGKASPTAKDLWDSYLTTTKSLRSSSFMRDLINDSSGPTIHRFQIFAWTIILTAIYIGMVYSNLETPTFGNNLLAVMGISGGTYLGFKIPEK